MNKSNDNYVDLLAQNDDVRAAVRVTEVTGTRTVFTREGRNVAILLSWDEYLALAETVRLSADPRRIEHIRAADDEIARTGGALPDEIDAETVRIAQSVALPDDPDVRGALAAVAANPIAGAPLFDPLRGFWVYRQDRVRIVYRVSRDGSTAGVVLIDLAEEPS